MAEIKERGRLPLLGRARRRLRRARGRRPQPQEVAARAPQRHDASPRYDEHGRRARRADLLLRGRRLRRGRGRHRRPNGSCRTDDRPALPVPHRRGAARAHPPHRAVDLRPHARERAASWRTEQEVRDGLLHIWAVMQECVRAGCEADRAAARRAAGAPAGGRAARAAAGRARQPTDPLRVMDWVTLFALAVNEENAAGGRVVTAPTNGAAGIIPAVLHYYARFVPGAERRRHRPLPAHRRRDRRSSSRRTPRSRAPRSAARARSAPPARWPPARWRRCSAAPPSRSRTPPRSAWSTTSA